MGLVFGLHQLFFPVLDGFDDILAGIQQFLGTFRFFEVGMQVFYLLFYFLHLFYALMDIAYGLFYGQQDLLLFKVVLRTGFHARIR